MGNIEKNGSTGTELCSICERIAHEDRVVSLR